MSQGRVYLVGGGPGDPGLITVRGLECLRHADVVVYDRLIGRRMKRYAPQAEWIDVGKQPNSHPVPQEQINAILVEQARRGRQVVRLKGGDPFVFGRGGEEALALAAAGIAFEVIPGITSAVAVPAYAGIPVTQRSLVTSLAIMTGHRAEESIRRAPEVDCSEVHADTRVFLMGVHNLPAIVQGLRDHGCPGDTPAAVIAQGTTPQQQVVSGTLGDIVARAAHVPPPAIIVVGEVVRLRDQMRWFDLPQERPLLGLNVLNTRPRESGGLDELTAALEALGAEVYELPAFQVVPPADTSGVDAAIAALAAAGSPAPASEGADRPVAAIADGGRDEPGSAIPATQGPAYDWILFTSANAVRFFLDRITAAGHDLRILAGAKLGAVGKATAEALRDYHLRADFVPSRFTGADWAAEIGDLSGRRLLLPRSAIGMADLPRKLAARGAQVHAVTAYEPAAAAPDDEALAALASGQVHVAVFFSPSALNGVLQMLANTGAQAPAVFAKMAVACIGPTTAAAAQAAGLHVDIVPGEYTLEGLVEALVEWRKQAGER